MNDAARTGGPRRPLVPALAADLAAELLRRAGEDRRLTSGARADLTARRVLACRRENGEALKAIVRQHGWPTARAVGEEASTAALMVLLHTPDLSFQLACRDLIAEAAADGTCPGVHHAFIADHCAVELGVPQYYGTRIDPAILLPYEIRNPRTLDERRRDVGLGPLDEQLRALRRRS